MLVTFRVAVPEFLTCAVRVAVLPRTTEPNERVAGVRAMDGAGVVTPDPESVTLVVGAVVSLLDTVMDPLSVVVSVGV